MVTGIISLIITLGGCFLLWKIADMMDEIADDIDKIVKRRK